MSWVTLTFAPQKGISTAQMIVRWRLSRAFNLGCKSIQEEVCRENYFLVTFYSTTLEKGVYYNGKVADDPLTPLAKEMRLNGPNRYYVTIMDQSATVRAPDGTPHFVAPATVKGLPKLYVASKEGVLLYAGATNQSMSVRLRGGLTADGAHGYHGYSWGKKNHTICLDIWY